MLENKAQTLPGKPAAKCVLPIAVLSQARKEPIVSSYVRQLEEAEKARKANHQRYLRRRKAGFCTEVRIALRYRHKTPDRYKASFGCTYAELALHIERQFADGMTWDNMGKWHIDHIVPLSYLIANRMESRANHYTNLRPLWAKDNLSKGAKLCKLPN